MITQTDWDLFLEAYQSLAVFGLGYKPPGAYRAARRAWQKIADESTDPKARAIARSLLSRDNSDIVTAYIMPLERWTGGDRRAPGPGRQCARDYPDVFVFMNRRADGTYTYDEV